MHPRAAELIAKLELEPPPRGRLSIARSSGPRAWSRPLTAAAPAPRSRLSTSCCRAGPSAAGIASLRTRSGISTKVGRSKCSSSTPVRRCAHATSAGRGLGGASVHRRRRSLAGRACARRTTRWSAAPSVPVSISRTSRCSPTIRHPRNASGRSGRNSHHSSDAHACTGTSRLGSHRLDDARQFRDTRANGSRRHGTEAEQQRIGAFAGAEVVGRQRHCLDALRARLPRAPARR